jgi:hypothetical protein
MIPITIEDLKKKSSCELHDYFTNQRIFLIQKTDGSGKTTRLSAAYYGTVRNLVRTKPTKL